MGLSLLLSLFPKLFLDMFSKASFKGKVTMMFILMIIVVSLSGYFLTKEKENELQIKHNCECPEPFVYTPTDGLLHMPDSHSLSKGKDSH